jgi:hypothetical protein
LGEHATFQTIASGNCFSSWNMGGKQENTEKMRPGVEHNI